MDEGIRRTIDAIHAAPCRCVMVLAGGGSDALSWLLRIPGASGTLLEAVIPYSPASLSEFLGAPPRHFASEKTASAMAEKALSRAHRLRAGQDPILGVGCAAALATTRQRRGEHRAHISLRADNGTSDYSIVLIRGARTREQEEEVCSRLLLHALSLACQVLPDFDIPLLPGEAIASTDSLSPLESLLNGRVHSLYVDPEGRINPDAQWTGAVLSGAFNPLHDGHIQLARAASYILSMPAAFELSLENVDKVTLSPEEAVRRARQFAGWGTLFLTRAPTFREKVHLFPGCVFAVGVDTAARIAAPRYYAGEQDLLAALGEIRELGCSFLVAGRLEKGIYRTLADVPVPPGFRSLFREIPESRFRVDISSTELRERTAHANFTRSGLGSSNFDAGGSR